MRRRRPQATHRYPRTARLKELVREIVADELERLDDVRLELVTVTEVVVEPDLRHATVYFDTVTGGEDDDVVLDALASHRARLQGAIASQARMKRTPELTFRPDDVQRAASRVDEILRGLHRDDGDDEPPGG